MATSWVFESLKPVFLEKGRSAYPLKERICLRDFEKIISFQKAYHRHSNPVTSLFTKITEG